MKNIIVIFDIGKTNKKILFFDENLVLIHQHEQHFDEILDEDGFPCDDISKIENWITSEILVLTNTKQFCIKAINFTTYGATLLYLNEKGERLTPVYNYLKEMPSDVLNNFYEKYGGVDEFSRKTASPALGMLNSGLQILWLKRKKVEIFKKVKYILHFPQYLSYLFTKKITSEYTSVGCHTAIWDYNNCEYHSWLKDEGVDLPKPESNFLLMPINVNGKEMKIGSGFHDSSASLIPYLLGIKEKFILISTGTWSIFMNPFNEEPLTIDQLHQDTLCYLSIYQKQVKSSRLFMGHIHQVNTDRISEHFNVSKNYYKSVKANEIIIEQCFIKNDGVNYFFRKGVPDDYLSSNDLSKFSSFEEAYHQLVLDLVRLSEERLNLITCNEANHESLFITGGFSRNEIYTRLLATIFPDKKFYTSEIDNATALGGALATYQALNNVNNIKINLGLKEVRPFQLFIMKKQIN